MSWRRKSTNHKDSVVKKRELCTHEGKRIPTARREVLIKFFLKIRFFVIEEQANCSLSKGNFLKQEMDCMLGSREFVFVSGSSWKEKKKSHVSLAPQSCYSGLSSTNCLNLSLPSLVSLRDSWQFLEKASVASIEVRETDVISYVTLAWLFKCFLLLHQNSSFSKK